MQTMWSVMAILFTGIVNKDFFFCFINKQVSFRFHTRLILIIWSYISFFFFVKYFWFLFTLKLYIILAHTTVLSQQKDHMFRIKVGYIYFNLLTNWNSYQNPVLRNSWKGCQIYNMCFKSNSTINIWKQFSSSSYNYPLWES